MTRVSAAFSPDDHDVSMECTDLVSRLLAKRPQDRLGAGSGSPGTPEEVTGIQQVQSHAWFSALDWGALERLEAKPEFKPSEKAADCFPTQQLQVRATPLHRVVIDEQASC